MTPTYSTPFAGDASLRGLYQDLLAAGETQGSLDRGYASVDYSAGSRGSRSGSADRSLESAELFERITASGSHDAAYRRFAGEVLPWQASSSTSSARVLRRFDQSVAAWRREHHLPSGVNRALAEHVYNWLNSASGLGMSIVENQTERSLDEVFVSRRGDCTESTKVLLNLLTRVGFQPYPVWVHEDSSGLAAQHIVTGLDIGGSTFLLDPVYGSFNQPHRRYTRLSLREFLAWHWNNRGLDLQSGNPRAALADFNRALDIDPLNPHILVNRGMLRRDQLGNPIGARLDFQAALTVNAGFAPAQFQLGNMDFDAGRFRDAAARYRLAVSASPGNSDYRRNLILALLQLGSPREARPHFLSFCSLSPSDPDIPRFARLVGVPIPGRTRP